MTAQTRGRITRQQDHAIKLVRLALDACRIAGVAMTPGAGCVRLMTREGRRWTHHDDLVLPEITALVRDARRGAVVAEGDA